MKKEELVKALAYLGLNYGKEYTQLETEQIYEFVKEYNNDTFVEAVKNIIKTSKFVPKIADFIEECEKCKSLTKNEVVKFMLDSGYFNHGVRRLTDEHAYRNYCKTLMWVERGTVPDWLQEDINEHYKIMKQAKLTHASNKLLS